MSDDALFRTHEWFTHNSGWAPPDEDTLSEWLVDGVCRAPDDCLVEPEGTCPHGLASWLLVLRTVEDWPPRADPGAGPASGPRRPAAQERQPPATH